MSNSKTHQSCWNCAHFQRYWDETDDRQPELVCGECRAQPIFEQQGDSLYYQYNWSFILDGTDKWCGHWKRSTVAPPDVPTIPVQASLPETILQWEPWNRRANMNISCWKCNHFQRSENTSTDALGVCTKNNPNKATHIDVNTYADTMLPTKPLVIPGDLYWCGSWEVAEVSPPNVPDTTPAQRPSSWFLRSGGEQEIYVDINNGDDVFGDGTSANPFKTFQFMERLPEKLTNDIKIRPAAGEYVGSNCNWPKRQKYDPSGGGRLILDASGETWPIIESGLIIGSITPLTNTYNGYALATQLNIAPSPAWVTDEQYPYFIHMTSGNWLGYVLPIFSNGADAIITIPDWFGFAPGDTFNIVDCPVKIEMSHEFFMKGIFDITTVTESNDRGLESPSTPWFITAGIHLQANNGQSGNLNQAMFFERMKTFHAFSKFTNGDHGKKVLKLQRVESNLTSLPVGTLDYPLFETWDTIATKVLSGSLAPSSQQPALEMIESYVQQYCIREEIRVEGERRTDISYSMIGGLDVFHGHVNTDGTYVSQRGFTGIGINLLQSSVEIIGVHIDGSNIAIKAYDTSYINTAWLQGLATHDEAVHLQHKSVCMVDDIANCTLTGAVDDVLFVYFSTVASWPIASGPGTLITTAMGDVLGA